MATATALAAPAPTHSAKSAVGLFLIAFLAILIIPLLYTIYTSPSVRDLGFTNPDEIRNRLSALAALLILLSIFIYHRGHPATVAPPSGASGAASKVPRAGSRGRSALDDPMSRPGAPYAYEVPDVPADLLEGGWRRYKFPAERTGGLYVDTDIVVDEMRHASAPGDSTPRGRYIMRVRDEVARVCVRCELIDHCHGAVASLLTQEDMLANFECVPGLRKMAQVKLEQIKSAREPPPSALPEPEAPAQELASEAPVESLPAQAGDAAAPYPDPTAEPPQAPEEPPSERPAQ
jgi:hypothetical protein